MRYKIAKLMASTAYRKYRASLARGNALFFRAIRQKERDTYLRRAVLEHVMYLRASTDGARRVVVIPAQAGPPDLDPGVRRDDVSSVHPRPWQSVQHT